jgi:hypothetical protein
VGALRPQNARSNHISTKSRHEVCLAKVRLTSGQVKVIAFRVG